MSSATELPRNGSLISPSTTRIVKRTAVTVCIALLALAPAIGASAYTIRTIMLVGILSLLASGLNIVLGYAGELAVSQVFLYATGAYVTGYLGVEHGVTEVLVILPVVIAAAVIVGLVTGIPGLRLGGWSLAMVSFFMVLIIPSVVIVLEPFTNGPLGLSPPLPTIAGQLLTSEQVYWLTVAVVGVWFLLARNLVLSRHGNAFMVMRQSKVLASSVGISVFRLKLIVYVIGAVPCALAGALFAWMDGFVSANTFTFAMALSVLAASIFGGSASIYGAIFGAGLLQVGKQRLTDFQEWELIIYGVFLILAVLLFKEGLAGVARRGVAAARRRGWLPPPDSASAPVPAGTVSDLDLPGRPLTCAGVSKRFGGNIALDDVDVDAQPGEITALIGPNGSGKTTLLNVICGYYRLNDGVVRLGDTALSGSAAHTIARKGLARTFQTPLVTRGMTTLAFVVTGRYIEHAPTMLTSVLRLPGFRSGYRDDDAEAMRILSFLGIADLASTPVDALPLGTRRLAEVARTLCSGAGVFLFDEVASGLDHVDLDRLKKVVRLIRDSGGTVILVEHNFPLVLEMSDRIHVLSRGSVLASGTPDEIRTDPRVLEEYIGRGSGGTSALAPGKETDRA